MSMELNVEEENPTLSKLITACYDLKSLLQTSEKVEVSLDQMDKKLGAVGNSLTVASKRIAPLQTLSIANKALETRINRAISPALLLLESFKLSESLQTKIIQLASTLSQETVTNTRMKMLIKYVDCVDDLNEVIEAISQDCEPTIQKLQEVVEFLSRTKATDNYRIQRLRETLITLKILYETEVDAMKFHGLLDDALTNLQDEYDCILLQIRHKNIEEAAQEEDMLIDEPANLGSDLEIEVLERITQTLTANDCLDICIDIYVKTRYRRAAKTLMRLNPDYLKTYTPEGIDAMEWENLETSISLWIKHFGLTVKSVLVSEKRLCNQLLGSIMEGVIWPECFIKIADKIMAVFFRFGEGVARSNKEPQKLFKLLDMFDSVENIKPQFYETFEGEASADICSRFRELEKLLVHASTKVFSEFSLKIEGIQDFVPPPSDGSVPKIVRYAINYLKYLSTDAYSVPMARAFRIEQSWKAGILAKPETDESFLKDSIFNVMEAIQRNVEEKKSHYKDRALSNIFVMNTYWYIYMRTRNSELAKLTGENYMRKKYKNVAEESAYMYQKQAWGSLVRLLDEEELTGEKGDAIGPIIRGKMEAFMTGFDEMLQRHRISYSIADEDLRDQIRNATINYIVPAYIEFLNSYSTYLPSKLYLSPESVEGFVGKIFDPANQQGSGDSKSMSMSKSRQPIQRKPYVGARSRESDFFRRNMSVSSDASR